MSSRPRSFLTQEGKVDSDALLKSLVMSLSSVPQDEFFLRLLKKIDDHFDCINSNDMTNLKRKSKSALVGAFFEDVCFKLCKNNAFEKPKKADNDPDSAFKMEEVWMFADFPADLKEQFSLGTRDMGIDLIAKTTRGKWMAIQCKYRRKPKRARAPNGVPLRWSVPWKDLATFYSLCERTGPPGARGENKWFKHIVMTNATSVNRQGRKNTMDHSVCNGSFRNIPKHVWMTAAGLVGHSLLPPSPPNDSEPLGPEKKEKEVLATGIQTAIEREKKRQQANAFLDRLLKQQTVVSQ